MEAVTLKNGLRIIFDENGHMRSASVNIYIGCGSRYEPVGCEGVSHFIEHMLFKGTQKRSCADIAEQMDEIGGRLNAFTTKEYTCIYTHTLSYHVETALDIMLDMLLFSAFNENDIRTEKGVICEEISMYEDSPEDVCFDLMCAGIWQKSPLGRPIIGSRTSVNRLSRSDITSFMRRYYTPDNMVVSVSGRFDRESVYSLIEKAFARFDAAEQKPLSCSEEGAPGNKAMSLSGVSTDCGSLLHTQSPITSAASQQHGDISHPGNMTDSLHTASCGGGILSEGSPQSARSDIAADALPHFPAPYLGFVSESDLLPEFHYGISLLGRDFEQTNIILAFPGLPVGDDERYTAALMSSIAGASSSSRLNRRIREELGMAYSIYSFHTSHIGAGVFGVSAGVSDANQGSVINETLKLLLSLKSDITQKELHRAKQHLKSSIAMSMESTASRSSSFGHSLLIDGRIEDEDDAMAKIDAVTLDDVKGMAGRIIDLSNVHIAVAGHAESEDFYKSILRSVGG